MQPTRICILYKGARRLVCTGYLIRHRRRSRHGKPGEMEMPSVDEIMSRRFELVMVEKAGIKRCSTRSSSQLSS